MKMKKSILSLALFALLFTACTRPSHPKTSSPEIQTVTLQFVDFSGAVGPGPSYTFKDSAGLVVYFNCNKDPKTSFFITLSEEEAKIAGDYVGGDPKLKGKWFKIHYQPKEVVIGCTAENKEIVDCIVKAELIADSIKTDSPQP